MASKNSNTQKKNQKQNKALEQKVVAALSTGQQLKEAREALKKSHKDVAKDLKISASYLQDLEEENFANLPQLTYTLGFVRSYATYLNFDAKTIVADYKKEIENQGFDNKMQDHFKQIIPPAQPKTNLIWIGLVSTATLLAIALYFFLTHEKKNTAAQETLYEHQKALSEDLSSPSSNSTPEMTVISPEAGQTSSLEQVS